MTLKVPQPPPRRRRAMDHGCDHVSAVFPQSRRPTPFLVRRTPFQCATRPSQSCFCTSAPDWAFGLDFSLICGVADQVVFYLAAPADPTKRRDPEPAPTHPQAKPRVDEATCHQLNLTLPSSYISISTRPHPFGRAAQNPCLPAARPLPDLYGAPLRRPRIHSASLPKYNCLDSHRLFPSGLLASFERWTRH